MADALYTPDSADIALWTAWARETVPGQVEAVRAREEALPNRAGAGSLAVKWTAFFQHRPSGLGQVMAEVVANWCIEHDTPFADAMASLVLLAIIKLDGEGVLTEAGFPDFLADAVLFLRDAAPRVRGWHLQNTQTTFGWVDIEGRLLEEYLQVVRAKHAALTCGLHG